MRAELPQSIKLTEEEQTLHDAIEWSLAGFKQSDAEIMAELARSLLDRDAIPDVRISYFTDPEMNVGGRGKSRQDVFESNGIAGPDILRHHDFLKHLRYFIHGPKLPKPVIEGFVKIIEDDRGTSGMLLSEICSYVRRSSKDYGLSDHESPGQFFMLAQEIGRPDLARNVYDACRKSR